MSRVVPNHARQSNRQQNCGMMAMCAKKKTIEEVGFNATHNLANIRTVATKSCMRQNNRPRKLRYLPRFEHCKARNQINNSETSHHSPLTNLHINDRRHNTSRIRIPWSQTINNDNLKVYLFS